MLLALKQSVDIVRKTSLHFKKNQFEVSVSTGVFLSSRVKLRLNEAYAYFLPKRQLIPYLG